MSRSVVAVVNPTSGGGRTKRRADEIKTKLDAALETDVALRFTERAGHAPELVRAALDAGADLILAVGGDGTANECVNGWIDDDGRPHRADAVLGLIAAGTGGDFRRTFDIPDDLDGSIAHLVAASARKIDVGRLTFTDDAGRTARRRFLNIASFGLSGVVDRRVNAATWSKWFGGDFTYKYETAMGVLGWRDQRVRLTFDDALTIETPISTVAVANGRCFGSGMMMAPDAAPDDGLFDVVVVRGAGRRALLKDADAVYAGEHLDNPLVSVRRARGVVAEPVDAEEAVLLDVDGEAPGRLPARFDVLPGVLNFLG